jgi:hypothetical protein
MVLAKIGGALGWILPTLYVVITGVAPMWARVIMGIWLFLWTACSLCGIYADDGAK